MRRPHAFLVYSERCVRQLFEVEVLRLFDRDADKEDRAALELAGRLVALADGIAAVTPDAETIARERALAGLRLHISLCDDLFVDVYLGLTERLAVFAALFADERHAECVFARPQLLNAY